MNYSETGFNIQLSENILAFSGSLEKHDYTEIDKFLKQVDQSLSSEVCQIELSELSFLNSSGIRSIASFILGSSKQFEIRINNEITWQEESIPTLTYLIPGKVRIL